MVGGLCGKSGLTAAAHADLFRLSHQMENKPFGELSFDSSKCFDSLSDTVLIQVVIKDYHVC